MAPQEQQSHPQNEDESKRTPEQSPEEKAFEQYMRHEADVLHAGPGLLPFVLIMRPLRGILVVEHDLTVEQFDAVLNKLEREGWISHLRFELHNADSVSGTKLNTAHACYWNGEFRTFGSIATEYHMTVPEARTLVLAEILERGETIQE